MHLVVTPRIRGRGRFLIILELQLSWIPNDDWDAPFSSKFWHNTEQWTNALDHAQQALDEFSKALECDVSYISTARGKGPQTP